MTESYDLRSSIKGKPGSQGTLFQVKDKGLLNPQQRWPQGYTPERLGEVRHALRATPVETPSHLYAQPDEEAQEQHGVNTFGYRERVHREIAKTTIPTEHLQGIKAVSGDPDEGTHGTYWKGGARDQHVAVDLTARTADKSRKTLTHEIGHHVNMTLAPTPHVHDLTAQLHAQRDVDNAPGTTIGGKHFPPDKKAPTGTDIAMKRSVVAPAVDEAQADNYAVEHFRTGGRKSKGTQTGAYEDNFSRSERDSHYPGYNDIRPPENTPEHQRSRAVMQEAQFQPGLFPRDQGGIGNSELRRRLGAHADANRQAMLAHVEAHGTAQEIRKSRKLKPRGAQ